MTIPEGLHLPGEFFKQCFHVLYRGCALSALLVWTRGLLHIATWGKTHRETDLPGSLCQDQKSRSIRKSNKALMD